MALLLMLVIFIALQIWHVTNIVQTVSGTRPKEMRVMQIPLSVPIPAQSNGSETISVIAIASSRDASLTMEAIARARIKRVKNACRAYLRWSVTVSVIKCAWIWDAGYMTEAIARVNRVQNAE
jgi:hypothetical protein